MINFILMHKSKKLFKMSNIFEVLFYLSFSCGSFHALIKDIMTRIQLFFCACLLSFSTTSYAQWANKPKLVVGIVVDQMRYDYLYKYWDKYSEGGFKRLIKEGFVISTRNGTRRELSCSILGQVYVKELKKQLNGLVNRTKKRVVRATHL